MNIKELKHTARGFTYREFEDANGVKCNVQLSSAYQDEKLIWLGANEIGIKRFSPCEGWKDVDLGMGEIIANNRMHLTQSQVKELLPILKKFAKCGKI